MINLKYSSEPRALKLWGISESSVRLQQPKPAPTFIRAGGKVELRCQVDGSGELQYEWFRNAKKLSRSSRLEQRRNVLVILEVRPEDNGVYRCQARNRAGKSTTALTVPLVVISEAAPSLPKLKLAPQSRVVRRGDRASLDCVFEGADLLQWFHEERGPLDSNDDLSVLENGTLVLHRVHDEQRGFYICHGLSGEHPLAQAYAAELSIAYMRNLTSASIEPRLPGGVAVVGEGEELQVGCIAPEGLPRPKLYWRDQQGRIISDSGPVRVQDDTLILTKARRSLDEGNYTCIAENVAGSTHISIRVIVSWSPELTHLPQPVLVLEDEPASLSCGYRGMGPPITQARWYKDGEPLDPSQRPSSQLRYRLLEHPGNASLIFHNAQLYDKGSYACELHTKGSRPIRSPAAALDIRERLKFSPEPIGKRLELNSTAKVSCKATGLTPPSFKWYKDGSAELPKHVQEANGTLIFNGVLEQDKGNYTCVASNSQGKIEHTIKIDVGMSPRFVVSPENVTAVEGSMTMLHCTAEGDPTPLLRWDRDSNMNNIDGQHAQMLPNGSLLFNEVHLDDEGKYGCTAGNSGGFRREEIYLAVKPQDGYPNHMDFDNEADEGSMMTRTVFVTLGSACAYMFLVIGLMLYCRCRRRRRKQRYLQEQNDAQEKGEAGENQTEQCELREPNIKPASSSSRRKENRESHKSDGTDTAHSQTSNHSKRSKSSYDKLAVSRSCLDKDVKPLGRGEFGDIFSTKYRPSNSEQNPPKESIVMVKVLNNTKDETVLQDFKRHLDFFHKLNHENITKLIGLCRDEEPDYMIIEYTDWGDLKQFMLTSRSKENVNKADGTKSRASQLTSTQIVSFANQVARALKHVADHRLVHKDVAARNCLITSDYTLKLSLPCMTKTPYQQEYSKHRNQVIPLRWMPKEAVFEDEYSTKSDSYSFACLVWEMFNHGELPFKKFNDDTILNQLKSQSLQWTPHKSTPTVLQELQKQCWSYDPRERPTFDEIVGKLQDITVDSSKV
ncbi:hypothetical protein QAD02_014629 [Eretmocerus hayati]|uniref:Uncharacterized protein n=1 Tax=Eretmocerus hayati TaxID=131215 RepID=A0ACC2P616_9HYME|nr:hypothetical protein QAD02_014629 [Eretmocerus hayati]